ncbi:hypothetical protein [Microcoleus sp. POL10_C6]|uniref:hypothetical protein n=1 Tax=unclassified Microcoleus TaxID=2642155 RepID=UPI002FD5DF0A
MTTLSPVYNYLDKWKDVYTIDKPIKVMHCTYPYRPQYAKNVTRSLFTRIVDRTATIFLPNQLNNPFARLTVYLRKFRSQKTTRKTQSIPTVLLS